ncbi:MAG TPA: patatin-like phospholipase family protein [Roseomonas sp.]|jgi:NTE family protein
MDDMTAMPRPLPEDRRAVALVLQGGGALGSYQAGVYEALAASPWHPDWVAGISIGAVNAAIIAGNAPERRVEKLAAFWESITDPPAFWPVAEGGLAPFFPESREAGALSALLFGQPGFFVPRPTLDWFRAKPPVSFYDTAELKGTLERLVDFDRINAREMRFSVGAVNVRTGNFVYFDNTPSKTRPPTKIRAEHVMASGALPPGFPPVEIDGQHYWDGGLVSNTPLQYVLETEPRESRITFEIDLFPARGPVPTTLAEAQERDKDIRYSSRTRAGVDSFKRMHDVRVNASALWEKLPEALRATPEAQFLHSLGCVTTMDVVEMIYRPAEPQGQSKDYAFSRGTMRERWAQGRQDGEAVLHLAPWTAPFPPGVGLRRFDLLARKPAAVAGAHV